jgi:membrane associated rhomboid family serine protease
VGWELWVILAASLLALQLFAIALKRDHREQLPYVGLMLIDLGLLCLVHSTQQDGALVGKVTTLLALVLVLVPRWLEALERRALARDDLRLALRATQLRALVQPGRATTRRRRQLANWRQARAGGAADVVLRLRGEIERARDPVDAAMLHEELATTLFLAHKFSDGVSVVERNLPAQWAGQHPAFGAYLLRAYGEIARLDLAAALLQKIEDGPAGHDPGALVLVTQARLTLLAFCGRRADVDRLLATEVGLLVSPRARQFLHDTARAHEWVALPEELARLCDGVAARTVEAARPLLRERRRPLVTVTLIVLNVAMWLMSTRFMPNLMLQPSGADLIRWGGLLRPAVHQGEWWRMFSAMFLHGDYQHIGLNMYALFILGRFCEDVLGPLRYFIVYVAGGLVGALGSIVATAQVGLSVGASGAIMGLLGALIIVLLLRRGTWPEAWRRTLLWNLIFLGALQIYVGFQLPMIDNAAHVGGMIGGAAMALVVAPGGLIRDGVGGRAVLVMLAAAMLGAFAWTGVRVARTSLDETLRKMPLKTAQLDGELLRVPEYFERQEKTGYLVDPYLEIEIAPHQPIKNADSRLDAYVERIEKSRRRP